MKQFSKVIICFVVIIAWVVIYSCNSTEASADKADYVYKPVPFRVLDPVAAGEEKEAAEWTYPIAPGVYYPWKNTDGGFVASARYYRVRCWPGCHRGSSIGMYPEMPLDDTPIFPTSTIDYPVGH